MSPSRNLRRALLGVALASSAAAVLPAASTAAQTCNTRVAETYKAGIAFSAAVATPIPGANVAGCINYTGFGGAEGVLRAAPNGDLFYSAAFTKQGVGILRSRDLGNTWQYRNTVLAGGKKRSRAQVFMDRDETTGRLFVHSSKLDLRTFTIATGFDDTVSDDNGETWTASTVGIQGIDMLRYAFGKPITSTLSGYPNIIYAMAPTPTSTPIGITQELSLQAPNEQVIWKSLNGGKTWVSAGAFTIKPTGNGCAATEWVLPSAMQVAKDGTLVVAGRRCDTVGLWTSRDEGKTWKAASVPGTKLPAFQWIFDPPSNPNTFLGDPIQIDSAGNVYVIYVDAAKRVRLTTSRDAGATWSAPTIVSAPAVYGASFPSIAVKAPGQIGIGYLGVNGGSGAEGYMAESRNALDPAPTFTSQIINEPGKKLHPKGVQSGYIMMFVGDDLNEWLHVRYAANGELFGAFTADMCPNNGIQFDCLAGWDYWGTSDRSRWQAVVGRLKRQ